MVIVGAVCYNIDNFNKTERKDIMKKWIAVILAVVMLLGATACGGNGQAEQTEQPAYTGLQVGFGKQDIGDTCGIVKIKFLDGKEFIKTFLPGVAHGNAE